MVELPVCGLTWEGRRGLGWGLSEAVGGAEALDGALGELLHVLCELVDLAASHVVGLAVVPDELNVRDHVVEGHVLPAL